mmetsp:Transcript_11318/g.23119  ORF Transcript_11318/g.23119 Transcript_11318/m.23119 type:complete len:584 (-) Transcript_11318:54-1805(-)
MGASGSIHSLTKNEGSLFYDKSPSSTPVTQITSSMYESKRSHERANYTRTGHPIKKSMLNPQKPTKGFAFPKREEKRSEKEQVHEQVKSEVTKHILSGTSLLCPTPALGEEVDSDIMGKVHNFRTTLFHHVALPAPLPKRLCKEDVNEFKSIAVWEEHLRQTKPWLDNQKVSDKASLVYGLQTDMAKKRNSDPSFSSSTPIEAFRSPRSPRSPRLSDREESKSNHPRSIVDEDATNETLLERAGEATPVQLVKPKSRGKTFVSLPVSRRDKSLRRRSVHKPDVQAIIHGLSIMLSYLIEEPPEKYIKKQSWDIFSVPGDKSKVVPPITKEQREINAGGAVISSETVRDALSQLYKICQWTSECHIIAFILMIRLVRLSDGKVALHRYNWLCMLCVSLMVSQKLWDDVSLNNVDFPQVWRMVAPKGGEMDLNDINFMEREFLSILSFEVSVGLRLYTSCYYDVMALALMHSNSIPGTSKALADYFGKSAVARYTQSGIHLLKGGKVSRNSDVMGDINLTKDKSDAHPSESEREDEVDPYGDEESSQYMSVEEAAKERAKRRFMRRHTADVLLKTPPRDLRRIDF